MRSSNTCITDDDDSATISDDDAATTETDMDVESKDDAVESLSRSKSTPFRQGEKVLAYHSRRIYEAKVLEVDPGKKDFYVHYQGWSKKWDEWVGMDRLMKHNKENLQKHPLEKITKSARTSLLKPKNPNATRGKKRKNMSKGNASYEKLIDLQIPSTLKKHLVDYCEYITHMGKLVKLPRSPNVDDILRLYVEHQSNKDGRVSDSAGEIVSGLRCYFDKALPAMLLYKGERQQYEEATANETSPSKIYGAEHLLRLFVKLPEILYQANIEEETLMELQHKLQDFLKFLQKKQGSFFLSSYETPSDFCTIE